MAYAAGAALAPVAPVEIEYPSSDGEPLAESYFQLIPLVYAFDALRRRYAYRDDVFVVADMLIYYNEGTMDSVAPDVFVVLGAENRPLYDPVTRSYLLSSDEEQQGRQRAEQRWQMEAAARRQAEARLHDEAAAHRQTEAARRQAEARLHDEAAARRQAEARIAALEAMLRERGENDTPSR